MTRNRIFALATLLTLPFTPGCFVYGDGGGYAGDVTFSWSFDGYSCYSDGYVDTVHLIIPGERLDNDGFYPCNVSGYDGITLRHFAPGSYSFDIEGIDRSGYVSYYANGHFHVDGDTQVRVDLAPSH